MQPISTEQMSILFLRSHPFQTLGIGDPVISGNVFIFRKRAVVVTLVRKFTGPVKV